MAATLTAGHQEASSPSCSQSHSAGPAFELGLVYIEEGWGPARRPAAKNQPAFSPFSELPAGFAREGNASAKPDDTCL